MKTTICFSAILTCFLFFSSTAIATPITIDFETNPASSVPSYTESGVTFTPDGGAIIYPLSFSFGRTIAGSSSTLGVWYPVRADISGGAYSVSVVIGDDNPDTDNMFLRAYDISDLLLAEDTAYLSGAGLATLSVSNPNIAYVISGSQSSVRNSSVGLDIFTYDPIPEPTSLLLLGTGLGILWLGINRRRKK